MRKSPLQARSLVNAQETEFPPTPHPPTQCCFLGLEQYPGKQQFPHQHCIKGKGGAGGGRSNGGRIRKGETEGDRSF